MKVPLFSPLLQNESLSTDLQAVFEAVLKSGNFILGAEVEAFEAEVAEYLGASYAVGVSSGTDALLVALMALEIGSGDEVIVPSFTFFATAGVVKRLGARPVFADVCPSCYQILPEEVERLLTERTRAVIPVHLFGHAADLEGIYRVLKGHQVAVVEDVAQSMGAKILSPQEGYAGTRGDAGCFSFFPTKNLGGFGDGGMVTTQDEAMAERLGRLRNHGMFPKYYHARVGGNFRIDALQAALLRIKLTHLEEYLSGRRRNARRYEEALSEHAGVCSQTRCGTQEEKNAMGSVIDLPVSREGQEPTWNQFTIRVKGGRRDDLRACLLKEGIGTEVYYPVPLHRQECFRGDCPEPHLAHTELLCEEVLSLPVYPELREEQLDHVIGVIMKWLD